MNNEFDLKLISKLLENETWTWAKTMPGIPHEYIVRDKCLMGEDNFLMIVHAQRELGTHEVWGKYNFPYLYIDGYKYWTMGASYEETIILNRQKVFSEFDNLNVTEDDVVPFGVASHLRYMIDGLLQKRHIYEVACGSGGSVKPLLLEAKLYTGIDPSKKAIARFKERYPEFASKIFAMSFEESVNYWSKGDSLILATFGAASYLMEPYLKILETSGKDYILMFYQEGKCPEEYKDTHYFHYTLDDIHRILPNAQVLPYYGCYIASNMNFHHYEIDRIINWELSHLEILFENNHFRPELPYNDLFCAQMRSIMRDGDRLLSEYRAYIQYHSLSLDYKNVADQYNVYVQKCTDILPQVHEFHKKDIEQIIDSATNRSKMFMSI